MTVEASLFGAALPAFAAVDRLLAAFLGPLPRLIAWGCLLSLLTMGLYRLLSPQRRLQALKADAAAARRQIAAFDGEFDQLGPLIRRSLALSLRQIVTILLPAILASLPLISGLMGLYSAYNFQAPAPGQPVAVRVMPAGEAIRAEPTDALAGSGEDRRLAWPGTGETATLFDRHGARLVQVDDAPGSDIVKPFAWWNRLIGNPAGYIPPGSPVQRLEFKLPARELYSIGPAWLRGWETPFFLTLIVVSLLIKVLFRIE